MSSGPLHALKSEFPGLTVKENTPWREVTSLKAGGVISAMAEPKDDIVLAGLLRYCTQHRIPFVILGNGTNLIGADHRPDLLVIRLTHGNFGRICFAQNRIIAGAGVRLKDFAKACAEHNFGGLAPLVGIPGRIGGLLRMNAGAHGVSISDYLWEICGFNANGESWAMLKDEIQWSYRHASIPPGAVITAAIFLLPKAAGNENELITDELKNRAATNPGGLNAGCFFRNAGSESAGRLIDEAGCKGLAVGDAVVSDLHANFIVNRGRATEQDMLELMTQVRRRVAEFHGIYLRPEVCFAAPDMLEKFYVQTPAPRIAATPGGLNAAILKNIGCEIVSRDADLTVPPELELTTERACGAWLRDAIRAKK